MTENSSPEPIEAEATTTTSDLVASPLEDYSQILREKILFGLKVYPYLMPTMMQVFLGTSTPTKVWKPILEGLITEGLVGRQEVVLTSPYERIQTYTILHLTTNPYPNPEPAN